MQQTMSNSEPELLTKTDVAKLLQVSGRQVENLVRLKKLPVPVRLGTHPRWRRGELFRFLDSLSDAAEGVTGSVTQPPPGNTPRGAVIR